MPDWSYRTLLRPIMLRIGPERSRRLATRTLRTLSRLPFGLQTIDLLGHMRADSRLTTSLAGLVLPGPIALGSLIDPAGEAVASFARFGTGLIEVGPVAERGNSVSPEWSMDIANNRIVPAQEWIVGADELGRNLQRAGNEAPIAVHLANAGVDELRRVALQLRDHCSLFVFGAGDSDLETRERVRAIGATGRPVLLAVHADSTPANDVTAAIEAKAAGFWVRGEAVAVRDRTRTLRAAFPEAVIVAGGIGEPYEARQALEAGANIAAVDSGLVCSGPGLIKRCNEALLSTREAMGKPESLSLDAARSAWFWAFLLGFSMFAGGLLAIVIASTRVVLPYDEAMAGMARAQLAALNPRLLPFMAHDRVTLAGTMVSIGIFYAALAWFGVRHGAHWAHVTVIVSAIVGFLTFFFFLGFGYFDPFHAFVTAILTQFTLLCLVMRPSPPQPPTAEWSESAAWRRGQWGQLLFILIGGAISGAGIVISVIGCTSVFVETDLMFLRTTAEELRSSFPHLVPLIAHDRASLGGMLIANGLTVLLCALWGFRAGAHWLWVALAWGGNIAFACATIVHVVVGYDEILHLTPAILGWLAWNAALVLTHEWLSASYTIHGSSMTTTT